MKYSFYRGVFVREEKNRFLCTVNVQGRDEECYIPSSCRLENFIDLPGRNVILCENQNKNSRTRLSVYALEHRRTFIVLKTSEANAVIRDSIRNRRFSFLGKRSVVKPEAVVDGYKSDIYLPETKTIVEVKSVIALEAEAVFPGVYSERAISQLRKLKEALLNDYKVVYVFVALNPRIKNVSISEDANQTEYRELFNDCIKHGMECRGYSVKLKDGCLRIYNEIPVKVS